MGPLNKMTQSSLVIRFQRRTKIAHGGADDFLDYLEGSSCTHTKSARLHLRCLPLFGNRTADVLDAEGRSEAVLRYVRSLAAGAAG